ncbi:MAG: thiol:disulfide interchange protein DsbA/DsbL [Gammaproteobacteria bacterium]|nr:thiol:disulfide interchange protein DsbA/DsbL [Gammaproteobacteria bacterium]
MPITKKLFLSLIVFLTAFSAYAEEDLKGAMEGVHYIAIKPAQPTSAPAGKVEVTELFWYGCPHCFKFEPYVKGWLKKKSDNIVFNRIPAMLTPKWESHARAYYAAEVLGVLDKVHEPLFIALHVEKKRLFKEEDILDFVESQGVDRQKFANAYRSFAVSAKVQQSKKLTQAYKINGVPSVVVNGKFLTSASHTGSFEGVVVLMNQLALAEIDSLPALAETKTLPGGTGK